MSTLTRGTLLGIAVLAATTGLAGHAAADAPDGTYALTVVQGDQHMKTGTQGHAKFSPCGENCIHVIKPPENVDLHPQGDSWFGTAQLSTQSCTLALDNAFQTLTEDCPSFGLHLVYSVGAKR